MRRWVTYILFIMATVGVNARQYTETQPDSTYYSCALELILKRDYEKARSVLHQGLTFATGEMRIKSIQKIGLSWYFEGCVLKLQNKNKEAYRCFIEARKSFQEISDKGDEMSVLKQMAEIEKRFYSADEAMKRYNEVVNIARQIPDTLMWIDALKGQSGVLKELGEWEEYLQLSLRLDSLMSNVGDVNIQMELNYERGDIEDFRNKICAMAQLSDEELGVMSENSVRFISNRYNYADILKEYLAVFDRLNPNDEGNG